MQKEVEIVVMFSATAIIGVGVYLAMIMLGSVVN